MYINCFFVFVLTFKTIYVHNMFWACSFHARTGKSMNNLSSYCGLVDPSKSASDKDLPVQLWHTQHMSKNFILRRLQFMRIIIQGKLPTIIALTMGSMTLLLSNLKKRWNGLIGLSLYAFQGHVNWTWRKVPPDTLQVIHGLTQKSYSLCSDSQAVRANFGLRWVL